MIFILLFIWEFKFSVQARRARAKAKGLGIPIPSVGALLIASPEPDLAALKKLSNNWCNMWKKVGHSVRCV